MQKSGVECAAATTRKPKEATMLITAIAGGKKEGATKL